MINTPVYQQYDDDYRLLLIDLLLFLSLNDSHIAEYLSCLDSNGEVRTEHIKLGDLTPVFFNPLKSLSKSANENNMRIFSLSLSDLLPDNNEFPSNTFIIRLKLLKLRSIFRLLFWLTLKNPETSSLKDQRFIEVDLKWIKKYLKINIINSSNYKKDAQILIGQNTNNFFIRWNIFNPNSVRESPIWLKARSLASEILLILNMSNMSPASDICSIAIQFED
jgi:hypothetical protein